MCGERGVLPWRFTKGKTLTFHPGAAELFCAVEAQFTLPRPLSFGSPYLS